MKVLIKTLIIILVSITVLSISFTGCKDDDDIQAPPIKIEPTEYSLKVPDHFFYITAPIIPEDNPLTVEGVALGKKLYYENRLSKGGPFEGLACASCHLQSQSFSSNGSPFNQVIPHFNLAWSSQFLWSGKIEGTLEDVMRFEVDDFFQTDLSGINTDPVYINMFKSAFGSEAIDSKHTSYALAQFLRTLISGNSRYDQYVKSIAGVPYDGSPPLLSEKELRGMDIYFDERKGDCFHCHGGTWSPLLTSNDYVNNGLDLNPDSGLAEYTKRATDVGKFKTPSLRNLVFTAPYMHDGRFQTLREVVDFYADQVQFSSPNLDGFIAKPRYMSSTEREDLVAFLKTMTDSSFVQNSSFRP